MLLALRLKSERMERKKATGVTHTSIDFSPPPTPPHFCLTHFRGSDAVERKKNSRTEKIFPVGHGHGVDFEWWKMRKQNAQSDTRQCGEKEKS